MIGRHDPNINNGVYQPTGTNMVFLFVNEKKEKYATPYDDRLLGEILEWDGQKSGRTDKKVIKHREEGLDLLVFYREHRHKYPDYAFLFLGTASYLEHEGSEPTHFKLLINSLRSPSAEAEEQVKTYTEGEKSKISCYKYERDPVARSAAIKIHGLDCQVCGFNFEEVYGDRGSGYIEVHHKTPLSDIAGPSETDPKTDLVILCSNCHRMIHRVRDDVLQPDELKDRVKRNNGAKGKSKQSSLT